MSAWSVPCFCDPTRASHSSSNRLAPVRLHTVAFLLHYVFRPASNLQTSCKFHEKSLPNAFSPTVTVVARQSIEPVSEYHPLPNTRAARYLLALTTSITIPSLRFQSTQSCERWSSHLCSCSSQPWDPLSNSNQLGAHNNRDHLVVAHPACFVVQPSHRPRDCPQREYTVKLSFH